MLAADDMKPDVSRLDVPKFPSVHYRTDGPYFHTLREPVSTFYKDEGGQSNMIIWEVALRRKEKLERGRAKLPVELRLFQEGNVPVYESSCKNYIKFYDYAGNNDPPYVFHLDTSKDSIAFKFRLKKVSSRCENKNFYLKLSGKCDELRDVEILESCRINVKSKRKHAQRCQEEQDKLKRKRRDDADDSDSEPESYDATRLLKKTAHISNSDRVSHSSDLMNGLNSKLKEFESAAEKLNADVADQNKKISELRRYIIGEAMQPPTRLHTFQQ